MRADGRLFDQLRNIKITPNVSEYAEGSAIVEFGRTKFLCTATYESKAPSWLLGTGAGWITAEYGMRNNPGGFFDTAIDISSDFIEKGVAVSQKGKLLKQDYQVNGNPRLARYPVEVLVNRGSASASEIVAGALRDQKGAKLYGEKTFGKGTVQDRRQLSNGGGLHVTIAQWLLPKGDSIHETGIPADVEVADNLETPEDEVLQKAIQDL